MAWIYTFFDKKIVHKSISGKQKDVPSHIGCNSLGSNSRTCFLTWHLSSCFLIRFASSRILNRLDLNAAFLQRYSFLHHDCILV